MEKCSTDVLNYSMEFLDVLTLSKLVSVDRKLKKAVLYQISLFQINTRFDPLLLFNNDLIAFVFLTILIEPSPTEIGKLHFLHSHLFKRPWSQREVEEIQWLLHCSRKSAVSRIFHRFPIGPRYEEYIRKEMNEVITGKAQSNELILMPGKYCDATDRVNRCYLSEILSIDDGSVLVHYMGWECYYDEHIDVDDIPRRMWKRGSQSHDYDASWRLYSGRMNAEFFSEILPCKTP
jgi:hypothetical protein